MRHCAYAFFSVLLCVTSAVYGATSSGESSAGHLETLSPALIGMQVLSETAIEIVFSEPLLFPGNALSENYTLSGTGAGTLVNSPDSVTGSNPYTLQWSMGEMLGGEEITLEVQGIQDLAGNPLNPSQNSVSVVAIGVPPAFLDLAVTPARAAAGERVTITFTASEPLVTEPSVMLNGRPVTLVSSEKTVNYIYNYTVQSDDSLGMATITVSGFDLAGNLGVLTDTLAFEIVEAEPAVPVRIWPVAVALLAAGLLALLLRRKRAGALLLLVAALLFVAPAAFAQGPEVTNVSFSQGPDGAGGTKVDIYYDLAAPNGPCNITAWLSKDGGVDEYIYPIASITGDIEDVDTGTGKHIVWDIRADYPEEDIPQARIKIIADDGVVQYTLSYTAGVGGTITGATTQIVNQGQDGTEVTAVADTNYHFMHWSDGVLTESRIDTNVSENIAVLAEFAVNPDTEPPVITLLGLGTITLDCGGIYDDAGATAFDDREGDLTSAIVVGGDIVDTAVPSVYIITYNVTDSSGNIANEVTRKVIVSANCDPEGIPETVPVPAGWFEMGRPYAWNPEWGTEFTDELPVHDVYLDEYAIGKYQITNQQYCDVLNWAKAQGYLYSDIDGTPWDGPAGDIYAGEAGARYCILRSTWSDISYVAGKFCTASHIGAQDHPYLMAIHPVGGVTWYGAAAYCNWLSQMKGLSECYDMSSVDWPLIIAPPNAGGFRLPTEAEWERAAAWDVDAPEGPRHWVYGFMSDILSGKSNANYRDFNPDYVNPLGLIVTPFTSPVGWFNGINTSPNGNIATLDSPSPVGAYDMGSNVGEWCHDFSKRIYTTTPETNPLGPGTGSKRMARGGSYGSDNHLCRIALRRSYSPSDGFMSLGFRIAKSIPCDTSLDSPVISLSGGSLVIVELGDSYTDPGATAFDPCDGDLTNSIVTDGDTVDTAVLGTYIITYNVTDAAGNAAEEVTRTVVVKEYAENWSFELDAWDSESPDGYRTTIPGWDFPGSGSWGLNRRNGPIAGNCGPGFDGDQFLFVQTTGESVVWRGVDILEDGERYDLSVNVNVSETSPGMTLEVQIGDKTIYGPITHYYREGFRELTIPFRYIAATMNGTDLKFVLSSTGEEATILLDNVCIEPARRLDLGEIMNSFGTQLDEATDNKWSLRDIIWVDISDSLKGYTQLSPEFPCHDHTGDGIRDDFLLKLLEPILNDEPCTRLLLGDAKVDQIQHTFMMNRNFVVSREFSFQSQLTNYSRITGTMTTPVNCTLTNRPVSTNLITWQTNAITTATLAIDTGVIFVGTTSMDISFDVPSLWGNNGVLNRLSAGFGDATADLLAAYMTIGDQNSVDYMQHILSLVMTEGFRHQQKDFLISALNNNAETTSTKATQQEPDEKSYVIPTVPDVTVQQSFSAPYPQLVIANGEGFTGQFDIVKLGVYVRGSAFQTGLANWLPSYELGTQELPPQVTGYTLQGLPDLLSATGDLNEDGQIILESYIASGDDLALFRTNEGMDCPDIVEGEPVVCFEYDETATILLPGDVPLELVRVPAGTFMMGRYPGEVNSYELEDPQHPVTIDNDFYMGKYEITQQQWLALMGSWPGTEPTSEMGLGDTYPAYYLSWDDAKNFVITLNIHIANTGQIPVIVHLPSEAEWEYACRAGTTTRFYFGDALSCDDFCTDCAAGLLPGNVSEYMWYCNNTSGSMPVGQKLPNQFGLFDMAGNISEWCEDDWHDYYTGAPADGSAWIDTPRASSRIARGFTLPGNPAVAFQNRSATRGGDYVDGRNYGGYGFRLAASIPVGLCSPDTTPPMLSLLGARTIEMTYGETYTDPGALAFDNCDGDLTNAIVIIGVPSESSLPGVYEITYNISDSSGNSAVTITRTVTIQFENEGEIEPLGEMTIYLPGDVPLELVNIPPGTFLMGSNFRSAETPVHVVTMQNDYWIGKYEVTQQQWLSVMNYWPGDTPGGDDTYPAYNVSWYDIQNFVGALNAHIMQTNQGPLTLRLPSEAEWEWACRAGTNTRFYFGNGCAWTTGFVQPSNFCGDCTANLLPGNVSDYMWLCAWDKNPVGQKLPNQFGLYDMSGNVSELCADDWHNNYSGAPTDGSAWVDTPISDAVVVRGDVFPLTCRSAARYSASRTSGTSGFRLAADASYDSCNPDTTQPLITLLGTASVRVYPGDSYTDAGAIAYDLCDGDLTSSILVGGDTVNTSTPGVYVITYNVTDSAGNAAVEAARVVIVKEYKGITIQLPGNVPLELVHIPAGTFMMGCYPGELDSVDNEEPQHQVTLSRDYYMGKYEITQQQWFALMGGNDPEDTGYYPAAMSWHDAQLLSTILNTFVLNLGLNDITFRLPTEAEWEYACRAGSTTRFYWGDDLWYTRITDYVSNLNEIYCRPVGEKLPNAFKLFDMSGNALEWCQDIYSATSYPDEPVIDPTGPEGTSRFRVCRSNSSSRYCRSAARNSLYDTVSLDRTGLRIAADIPADVFEDLCEPDLTPPVITLLGASSVEIECGGEYEDAGATAYDVCDGNLSDIIVVGGDIVDTAVPGTYTITYNVTDGAGNAAEEVTRTVVVADCGIADVITIYLPGNLPLTLHLIPAGTFMMGSYPGELNSNGYESPQHEVTLSQDFYLGKFEVSQTNWISLMGDLPGNPSTLDCVGSNYSAIVSWQNAQDFITALNTHIGDTLPQIGKFRLPTEAEWEYACRAGTTTRFFFGDALDCLDDCSDCAAGTLPGNVSDHLLYCYPHCPFSVHDSPNAFGLYDMHGKSSEWCQDWFSFGYRSDPVTDPTGPMAGNWRVLRGGSWEDDLHECRSANRRWASPDSRGDRTGFRIAVDICDPDHKPPYILRLGQSEVNAECGMEYIDEGATAFDGCEGDITAAIILGGDVVDPKTVGQYIITYNVSDSNGNAATEVTRIVNVIDTRIPVITVLGAETVEVECGDSYSDDGATAFDDCEGDLTDVIVVGGDAVDPNAVGQYVITYTVNDEPAPEATRTVLVTDTTAPVITLLGDAVVEIDYGNSYTEPGAMACDACEGDLTSAIVIGGDTVDADVPGTYLVTYNVTDIAGNAASEVVRSVTVGKNFEPEMINLPAGEFEMGRPYTDVGLNNELPVHTVYLNAYNIGKYSVTNQEFVNVLNWAVKQNYLTDAADNPYTGGEIYACGQFIADTRSSNDFSQITYFNGTFTVRTRTGYANEVFSMVEHPVVMVSWYGAAAYCNWLSEISDLTPCYDTGTWTLIDPVPNGYRLPTEAEWERAAAWDANESRHWRFGMTSDVIDMTRANYYYGSYANPLGLRVFYTSPVGWYNGVNPAQLSRPAILTVDAVSPSGAYDMSGNVWEWCHDWYQANYYSVSSDTNPVGPVSGSDKVLRGGSWYSDESSCRTARRGSSTPEVRSYHRGFRLAQGLCDPDTQPPTLTLLGEPEVTVECGEMYVDSGATAFDACEGDLTDAIVIGGDTVNLNATGVYILTYNVLDSALNAALQVSRTIHVVDTTAPVISLLGAETIEVDCGYNYTDAGAVASDGCDGDLTSEIRVGGDEVDTNISGTYVIRYSLTDSAGNTAEEVSRTLVVRDGCGPAMILVPEGSFEMGRPYEWNPPWGAEQVDELPVHTVYLDEYKIGKYPITNQEYADVLNWAHERGLLRSAFNMPYTGGQVYAYGQVIANISSMFSQIAFSDGIFSVRNRTGYEGVLFSMADHPMVMVSWYGAVAYCNWLSEMRGLQPCYDTSNWSRYEPVRNGYRLPTEAEWERAAAWNGAKHWRYGMSSDIIDIARANHNNTNPLQLSGQPYTSPVGWYNGMNPAHLNVPSTLTVKAANSVGAFDMSGNVREWCQDWYQADYYSMSSDINPTGPVTGAYRTLRGGSWASPDSDCRTARRLNNSPTMQLSTNGFRIVIEPCLPDTRPPVITLLGLAEIMIDVGTEYINPGATAWDACSGDLTDSIVVGGDVVDSNVVGTYRITYNVSDAAGFAAPEATQTVYVVVPGTTHVDAVTVLDSHTVQVSFNRDMSADALDAANYTVSGSGIGTLTEHPDSVTGGGSSYTLTWECPGIMSNGGDITITVDASVKDDDGNFLQTPFSRTHTNGAIASLPVITPLNGETVEVNCGNTYIDSGATAFDACGGDLTDAITVYDHGVNTLITGIYRVTYTVVDSAQNVAMQAISVVVLDNCAPAMIPVSAGGFEMGRSYYGTQTDDVPVHDVYLNAYEIGKFPITNKEYADVLNWAYKQGYLTDSEGNPYEGGLIYAYSQAIADVTDSDSSSQIIYGDGVFTVSSRAGEDWQNFSMENHPVVRVSWYGAAAYCNWRSEMEYLQPCYDTANWTCHEPPPNGYRLPTEAEWECAAAWDKNENRHWDYGTSSDAIDVTRANHYIGYFSPYSYHANPLGLKGYPYTSPVGWYNGINPAQLSTPDIITENASSPVGAYDMSGNVREWCCDWYQEDYYSVSPSVNPAGPESGTDKILRGGGWAEQSDKLRSARRSFTATTDRSHSYGFRVVRTL